MARRALRPTSAMCLTLILFSPVSPSAGSSGAQDSKNAEKKPVEAKSVRIRTADGLISFEVEPERRRRLEGRLLSIKIPDCADEYARISIIHLEGKYDNQDDLVSLQLTKSFFDSLQERFKGSAVAAIDGEKMCHRVDEERSTKGVMTFHTWFATVKNRVIAVSLSIPASVGADRENQIVGEVMPKLIKTCRVETPKKIEVIDLDGAPGDPVDGIKRDDEVMNEAIAEAKATLPELIDALKKPRDAVGLAVKAKFVEGKEVEWMWVIDLKEIDGGFTGKLNSIPINVKLLSEGEEVKIKKEDIGDWMYFSGGQLHGGYTVRASVEAAEPQERKKMLKQLNLWVEEGDDD